MPAHLVFARLHATRRSQRSLLENSIPSVQALRHQEVEVWPCPNRVNLRSGQRHVSVDGAIDANCSIKIFLSWKWSLLARCQRSLSIFC